MGNAQKARFVRTEPTQDRRRDGNHLEALGNDTFLSPTESTC